MTEKEVTLLGFSKENIDMLEDGDEYYYVLDIVNGFSLITNTNKTIENNDWSVEVFDTEPSIVFKKFEEVQSLINLLNKRKSYK